MKANKFVEKFGLGLVKQYLNRTKNQGVYIEPKIKLMIHQSICEPTTSGIDFVFHRDDLKRLVESHELVEKLGGINECLDIVSSDENIQIVNNLRKASNQTTIDAVLLKQSIADVESCQ